MSPVPAVASLVLVVRFVPAKKLGHVTVKARAVAADALPVALALVAVIGMTSGFHTDALAESVAFDTNPVSIADSANHISCLLGSL